MNNSEQLAYWKSTAISLKFENQLLRAHLEMLYKTIYLTDDCEPVSDKNSTEWVLSDEMKQFLSENAKKKIKSVTSRKRSSDQIEKDDQCPKHHEEQQEGQSSSK